jgi:hypothetical protein
MNTNLLDLNNDVLNIIGDYVKKDNNKRIQDYDFLNYVITELLHELKFNKLSKHKMGQIIYKELSYLIIIITVKNLLLNIF